MKIQTILNKISTYHHKNCDLLSWKFLPVIIKPWNYDQENLNLLSWKSRLIVIKSRPFITKSWWKKRMFIIKYWSDMINISNVHNKISTCHHENESRFLAKTALHIFLKWNLSCWILIELFLILQMFLGKWSLWPLT